MAYRSSTNRTGGSTSTPAYTVPAGAASGDIAIVCMYTENAGAITPPTGFTQKFDSGVINAFRKVVFWKRLTAADVGTYTFTFGSASWTQGTCALFSGRVAAGDPFTAISDASSSASTLNAPAITAAAGDDLIGSGFHFNGGGAWTPPSGMTERIDNTSDAGITLVSQDNVTSGSTGDKTFTTSGSASGIKVFLGALAVASAGDPPNEGSATGAVSRAGTATGARVSSGAASGTVARSGSATGATVHRGATAGTVARVGVATGTAPLLVQSGSAVGTILRAGVATGSRISAGSAIGAVARAGVATGLAPTVDGASGAALGTISRVGVATGARPSFGGAVGTLLRAGVATGITVRRGSAAGLITRAGVATGQAEAEPTYTVTVADTPVAHTVRDATATHTVTDAPTRHTARSAP